MYKCRKTCGRALTVCMLLLLLLYEDFTYFLRNNRTADSVGNTVKTVISTYIPYNIYPRTPPAVHPVSVLIILERSIYSISINTWHGSRRHGGIPPSVLPPSFPYAYFLRLAIGVFAPLSTNTNTRCFCYLNHHLFLVLRTYS